MKTCSCNLGRSIFVSTLTFGLVLCDSTQGACWTTKGPLTAPRAQHTATLLPNGQVLLAGGTPDGSAELYDPVTGTSVATGTMNVVRYTPTAVRLPSGQVLIAGGWNHGPGPDSSWLTNSELYDPGTGKWMLTGSLHTGRNRHTMTLLTNGTVLVAGGVHPVGGSINSAEIYDPASGLWTVTGSLTDSRYNHTATLLPDGRVLVAGGIRATVPPPWAEVASAEIYDPAAGTWRMTGSLNCARQNHAATLLPGGKVLAAGGDSSYAAIASVEIFEPNSGCWNVLNSLQIARDTYAMALLGDGKVLVAGGYGTNHSYLASSEVYDPERGSWRTGAAMHVARCGQTATLLDDEKLLVTGGSDEQGTTNSVEVFDYSCVPVPGLTRLTNAKRSADGSFQFSFTNTPGASFTVRASADPAAPLWEWESLGGALEVCAGQFQFSEPPAANRAQRFYCLCAP